MAISPMVSRDLAQRVASVAGKNAVDVARQADQAGSSIGNKILQDADPILKLVLGDNWAKFITQPRLPQNAGDQGPRWLTAITSRLDGQQRQGVSLAIAGNANLPTPLPGLTLRAADTTGVTLRRMPTGKLQLLYATQLDGGVAAQIRGGLTGGFEFGHFGLQVNAVAQAGVDAQGAENGLLTYELDPKNPQDMQALGKQLQGHLVVDNLTSRVKQDAQSIANWGKSLFTGKPAAPPPPTPGQAMTFADDFARQHLVQTSFNRGIKLDASAGVSTGIGGNSNGQLGLEGDAELMNNTYKRPFGGKAASPPGSWQNAVGDGISLLSGLFTPNAGAGASYNAGLEHTLDFAGGKYLRTTQALTSDHSLFANEGAFFVGAGQLAEGGRRYAVTYTPDGVQEVDRSIASTVKVGVKNKATLETQASQNLSQLLINNGSDGNDVLLATYTLDNAHLAQLKSLPASQVPGQLAKIFDSSNGFNLAQLVREHGDKFSFGGNFGIGAGMFTGAGASVNGDLSTQVVDTAGKPLLDAPSPDASWVQS